MVCPGVFFAPHLGSLRSCFWCCVCLSQQLRANNCITCMSVLYSLFYYTVMYVHVQAGCSLSVRLPPSWLQDWGLIMFTPTKWRLSALISVCLCGIFFRYWLCQVRYCITSCWLECERQCREERHVQKYRTLLVFPLGCCQWWGRLPVQTRLLHVLCSELGKFRGAYFWRTAL